MTVDVDAILAADEDEYRQLPLRYERACGWHVEELWRRVNANVNTCLLGANGSGKSRGGIASDLAYVIGLDHLLSLDGERIEFEVIRPPVAWSISGPTYKLMEAGVLQALRDLLGDWPNHYDAQNHTFTIRHLLTPEDDEREWSKLYVYPYDGPDPEGPRLDGVGADEMPPMAHWQALITRRKAGRPLRKSIRATPLKKREWFPILELYPDVLGTVVNGKCRIEAGLWDNKMIPPEQVAEELEAWGWGTDKCPKIAQSRLAGKPVNEDGSNPFLQHIAKWEARVREPRIERLTVQREREMQREGGGSRVLVPIECELRIFHDPVPGDVCFTVSDHGKGIRDGKHDADEIQVYSMRYKRLCATISEHLGGWGNGLASVELANRWGGQWFPLVTGGYAESALSAARTMNFWRIGHHRMNTKPGTEANALGITETQQLRNAAIGALEQAMQTDSVLIEDALTIETLAGCVIDHNGKIVGGPLTGWHDERLICAGVACHLLGNRKAPVVVVKKTPTIEDERAMAVKLIMGNLVNRNGKKKPLLPNL